MSGKFRTVYLYQVVQTDSAGELVNLAHGFWERTHSKLESLGRKDKRLSYRGRKYSGKSDTNVPAARDYIYLSKARPGADWPDIESDGGDTSRLSLPEDQALVEPMYLLPLENSNIVAALRTSGGPTPQALEAWLHKIYAQDLGADSLTVLPVLSEDQQERFASATGATKVHLKFKDGSHTASYGASGIETAVRGIEEETEGDATVEIGVSYGRRRPSNRQGRNLLEMIRDSLRRVDNATQFEATILRTDEDGNEVRDTIDFLKERIRYREQIGVSEDEPPTEGEVIQGLVSALQRFRDSTLEVADDELE